MPDLPISGLPAAAAAQDADEFAVNQGGTTKKVSRAQVLVDVTTDLATHIAANPIDHPDDSVTLAKIPDRTHRVLVHGHLDQDAGVGNNFELGGVPMPDDAVTDVWGKWMVPVDFVSDMVVKPVVDPLAAGDLYCEASVYLGAVGEQYNAHSYISGLSAVAVLTVQTVVKQQACAAAASGDLVTLWFGRDSTNVLDTVEDTVYFNGWIIEYTADH